MYISFPSYHLDYNFYFSAVKMDNEPRFDATGLEDKNKISRPVLALKEPPVTGSL